MQAIYVCIEPCNSICGLYIYMFGALIYLFTCLLIAVYMQMHVLLHIRLDLMASFPMFTYCSISVCFAGLLVVEIGLQTLHPLKWKTPRSMYWSTSFSITSGGRAAGSSSSGGRAMIPAKILACQSLI